MVSEVPPVIAGLAVGIALIVVFAISIPPAFNYTAEKVLQKVRNLPEVRAFMSKYPNYTEELTAIGKIAQVEYDVAHKEPQYSGLPGEPDVIVTRELHMWVSMDHTGFVYFKLSCHRPEFDDPDYKDIPGTVDEIQNNRCLEGMDTLG